MKILFKDTTHTLNTTICKSSQRQKYLLSGSIMKRKLGSQMHIDKGTMSTANPSYFKNNYLTFLFPRALHDKKILYRSRYSFIWLTISLQKRKETLKFMQMGLRDFKTAVPTRQSCLADYSCQAGQLLERSNTNILTPQDCLDSI